MLFLPHMLVLLLAFVFKCATKPILDAENMHTDKAHGRPKVIPSPLTTSGPQYVPKRSPVARDLYELPNGWVGRVDEYLSLLPAQMAASVLETFYNVVIDNVRHRWIQQQPVNSFTITWENLELIFFSATRTVPWGFILAFAQRCINLTRRGFVGRYDIYYFHMPTGEEISVQLLIHTVAAAA